jgi:chromosome partition protein MukE
MVELAFADLGQVVMDERFAELDLALRRGRHIDREDGELYAFLFDSAVHLEAFYQRLGCELIHQADGYYYLLPTSDKLGKRHLSVPEMLVGQALALQYLDPAVLKTGGVVTRDSVLSQLATIVGSDRLIAMFNPKKKRIDERVAQNAVRAKVADAIKKLAGLGFVELKEGEHIQLRSALMRFAEGVRDHQSPTQALQELISKGAVEGPDNLGEPEDTRGAAEVAFDEPPEASSAATDGGGDDAEDSGADANYDTFHRMRDPSSDDEGTAEFEPQQDDERAGKGGFESAELEEQDGAEFDECLDEESL